MFRPFYIAATGMDAYQRDLESIIDNVSNAQTTAFKRSRIEFANLFPQVLQKAVKTLNEGESATPGLELGSGVKIVGTPRNFAQGVLKVTNNPLDVAITGEGFFQYRMADGTIAYGRAGNFHMDNQGLVVDSVGHVMEPQLTLPEGTTGVVIQPDGRVLVQTNNQLDQQEIGQITLARFTNPAGLESMGDNLYSATVSSGDALVGIPGEQGFGSLEQSALEGSNVDVVTEMMRMVVTQRSFDIISKAVQGGEAMIKAVLEIAQAN
jgi:flagellar basal-body rod protein FlgG